MSRKVGASCNPKSESDSKEPEAIVAEEPASSEADAASVFHE
jgi:hypothetical protein